MNMYKFRNQKGAAVVEFALLGSLLLIFLVGIVEFGFLWLESNHIANAAREGARVAAKMPDDTLRPATADLAVRNYLKTFRLFTKEDGELRNGLISGSIAVTEDSLPDITPTVPTVIVTVTIDTTVVWKPLLWPLLGLLPGVPDYDENKLRFLTQSATYAIE
jgi:Flp pilus assembly protein TadG